jgi:hypothetical protein
MKHLTQFYERYGNYYYNDIDLAALITVMWGETPGTTVMVDV